MSAHDTDTFLCECADCVAEDLALLARHTDPLAEIAAAMRTPKDEARKEA